MRLSRIGLILILLFLLITVIPGVYGQWIYGNNQFMWIFFFGGMPWSIYGMGIGFFATKYTTSLLAWIFIILAYILNIGILYWIGFGIEKLYTKLSSKQ